MTRVAREQSRRSLLKAAGVYKRKLSLTSRDLYFVDYSGLGYLITVDSMTCKLGHDFNLLGWIAIFQRHRKYKKKGTCKKNITAKVTSDQETALLSLPRHI